MESRRTNWLILISLWGALTVLLITIGSALPDAIDQMYYENYELPAQQVKKGEFHE